MPQEKVSLFANAPTASLQFGVTRKPYGFVFNETIACFIPWSQYLILLYHLAYPLLLVSLFIFPLEQFFDSIDVV